MPEIDPLEISVHVKICIAGKHSKELWDEYKHTLPYGKKISLHSFQIDASRLDQAAIEIDAQRKDIFFYFVDQSELNDEFTVFMRSIQEPGKVGLLFVCGDNPQLPVLDELSNFVLTCPIQYEQFSYAVSLIGVTNEIIEGLGVVTAMDVNDVKTVLFRRGKASLLTASGQVNDDICQILHSKIDALPVRAEKPWAAIVHASLGEQSVGCENSYSAKLSGIGRLTWQSCNPDASIINSWNYNHTESDRVAFLICLEHHTFRRGDVLDPWENAFCTEHQEPPLWLRKP
jgi:hypothetical protein